MQRTLMDMPVDQLIHWMHSEIMLRDDDDLALEFPSLALVIDQRDKECSQINLKQIYNGHVAAVNLGKISVDLVNSPYFSQTALTRQSSFIPTPETFAFIIHKRKKVHQSILQIMQMIEEQNIEHGADVQVVSDEVAVVNTNGISSSSSKGKEADAAAAVFVNEEQQIDKEENEKEEDSDSDGDSDQGGGHEEGTTADLLDQVNDDEDNDEDEDDEEFVADEEDAQDHILDPDAAADEDVDEEEDLIELDVAEQDTGAVDHGSAESPASSLGSNKRGQDEMSDDDENNDHGDAGDDNSHRGSEPAAKKAKSDDHQAASSSASVSADNNAVESVSA
ncbi:hypothetical protein J3B02_002964 [Coemansia erecta]|nr:hypothetical protein J3B02_002964 [Coemansia erecta]